VAAGLAVAHQGPAAAEEAMAGATALQRMKLERRLAYLGTLGNNAPFIGLLGTVIGVVGAFDALAHQSKAAAAASGGVDTNTMLAIGEALVATAVGLVVAIPAVMANNYFQRIIKSTLANTEALSHVLLGWLKADLNFAAARPDLVEQHKPAKSVRPAKKAPKAEPEPEEEHDDEEAS
jgi:biopolymer transport protein ExbB